MSKKKNNKRPRINHVYKIPEEKPTIIELSFIATWAQRLSYVFIGSILILPALVFSPWTANSFELPKNLIFLILTSCLLLSYLVYKLETKGFALNQEQKNIYSLFGLYLIFKIISVFFSPNPSQSFWGGYLRQDGIIQHIFLIIFAVVVIDLVKNSIILKKMLLPLILTSGFIALYGLMQCLGIDFGLEWQATARERIASTLGNPLFLSLFLIFGLGYSIYYLKFVTDSRKWTNRILIIIILQVIALILTFSASFLLSLFLAVFFFLVMYLWPRKKTVAKFVLLGVILVSLVGGLAMIDLIRIPYLNQVSINNVSNLQRVYVWQAGLKAFSQKPLTGWGNDLFESASYANKPTALSKPLESRFDSAHNFIIDRLAMEGIFVALALVSIIAYSFITAIKKYNQNKDLWFLLLASLILALFINYSVSIPTITGYIMLFFSIGLIFSYRLENQEIQSKPVLSALTRQIIYVSVFIGLIILNIAFFTPVRADIKMTKSNSYTDALLRINLLNQATQMVPYREFLGQVYMLQRIALDQSQEVAPDIYQNLIAQAETTIDLMKNKFSYHHMTYLMAADYYDRAGQYDLMEASYDRALSLAPTEYGYYLRWAESYLKYNKNDLAIAKIQQAIDLDTDQPEPYQYLSDIYAKINQPEKSSEYNLLYKQKYNEKTRKYIGFNQLTL